MDCVLDRHVLHNDPDLGHAGTMAFAYSFTFVLLEVQDTLRRRPRPEATMIRAMWLSISTSYGFYMSVAVAGEAEGGMMHS